MSKDELDAAYKRIEQLHKEVIYLMQIIKDLHEEIKILKSFKE